MQNNSTFTNMHLCWKLHLNMAEYISSAHHVTKDSSTFLPRLNFTHAQGLVATY